MKPYTICAIALTFLIAFSGCSGIYLSSSTPRMTKEVLKSKMETGGENSPLVLDVRFEKHWTASEYKIRGAVRENPDNFESWSERYPKDKVLVLYCD